MTITHTEMLVRMAVAVLLGSAIGFERERKDHPAGLRTHILVALASAAFMIVSVQFAFFQNYAVGGLVHVDSSRIAQGVVMGMGFLGAGSIMRRGLDVHGLTTAASLWLVSAVGMAAGSGMYPEAVSATLAALVVLVALTALEARFKQRVKRRLVLQFDESGPDRAEVIERVEAAGAEVHFVNFAQDLKTRHKRFTMEVSLENTAAIEPWLRRVEVLNGLHTMSLYDLKPAA